MTKVAISFDDGVIDQFKWARALNHFGIVGTFYINPFCVGLFRFLNLQQLRRMHDEWGHTIANHFWLHEAPANGVSIQALISNLEYAKKWLVDNGFEDGKDLVALPYGSIGGHWTPSICKKLLNHCIQIRDVSDGFNDLDETELLGAVENVEAKFVDDKLNLVCFHQVTETITDAKMMLLFERISKLDVTSMKEIANV